MSRKYVSAEGFRKAAKEGENTDDLVIASGVNAEVKAADDEERALDFVISTASIDRHGDSVNPEGWMLENYRKNPVVLFGHDHSTLPVARAYYVRMEDGKLKARAMFTPEGMRPFNDTVYQMYKMGFMNAVSVGFLPRKWAWAEDHSRRMGIDFQEQELLEFSVVSVPANHECLVEAKSYGVDIEPLLEAARRTLGITDDHEIVHKAKLAEFHAAMEENKRFKTQRLVRPEPKKMSRLTTCALKLAKIKS